MQKNENRPGYKKTKVGWIPKGWSSSELGKDDHFLTSGSRGWSQYYSDEGDLFVRITNLRRGEITLDFSARKFVSLPTSNSEGARTLLHSGDILISITADLGSIGYFDATDEFPNAYVNQHIAMLRLNDGNRNSKFIAYYLTGKEGQKEFLRITDQGAKAGLNLSSIRVFPVAMPPLPEQEAIAGVLECWDRGIRTLENKIEKKRRIKKELMQRLLSGKTRLPGFSEDWKIMRLEKIGAFSKGVGIAKSELSETGVPCIRYGEIYTTDDLVIKDFRSYIPRELASQSQRISQNDLLFAGSGETIEEIGKSIAYMDAKEAYAGGDIIIFSPILDRARGDYLSYYFNTEGRRQLNRLGQGQSVVHIYPKNLKHVDLPLPELEEQKAIAEVLSAADREIEALKGKLDKWREQKKYLLNNLVTGTIRLPEFC